ncbi:MAG TPA: vWA domain-containing protein [Gammaproteobacteria bacterium]|nr:vWA domain-containing protein [Gammaproteobacteria bacterium]
MVALVLAVVGSAIGGPPAQAQPPSHKSVAVVLLMDSSGSMLRTDPHRLRVPAAKLLMALLSPADRVGLISFSDNGYPVLPLTPAGLRHKKRLFGAADKVSSKGAYTNLYAALAQGQLMLQNEAPAGMRKILVLMSDGRMDVGNATRDRTLTRRLSTQLLANLKQNHIEVYSIAFTPASDTGLLKTIATRTGGLFQLARNDRDLHKVFSNIFESTKHPEMLPIHGGRFFVDASIKEVTIVASKANSNTRIALRDPAGHEYTAAKAGHGQRWFVSDGFDMVTLPHPPAGSWQILASAGGDRAYVITNLGLKTNLKDSTVAAGASTLAEAWLSRDHKVIKTPPLLANTQFLVQDVLPDGKVSQVTLFDTGDDGDRVAHDAVFSHELHLQQPGLHKLRVIAKSATFERERDLLFQVGAAAPSGGAQPAQPTPEVAAAARPVAAAKPAPAAHPKADTAPKPAAAKSPPAAKAKPVADHKKSAAAKDPAPAPASAGSGNRMVRVIVGFVVVNAMLLLGLVGFAWWRNRSTKGAAGGSTEADDASA